jgi:hypothetical protein
VIVMAIARTVAKGTGLLLTTSLKTNILAEIADRLDDKQTRLLSALLSERLEKTVAP